MFLLIFFATTAIGISFLCSVMEAALLSITPSYIAQLEEKSPKWFKQVNALKQDIDTPLAAILTLNTIAHTVGAAGVGAQVAEMYGQSYLGLASAIMTLAILVLSEILPKTIGAKYWRKLVPSMCVTLKVMIIILRPFLYISSFIMGMFGNDDDPTNIKDEIKALAKMGRDEKVIDENKYRVIRNVINLQEVRVKDVMTPRTVVHTVKPGTTIKEFDKFLTTTPFSRFPIVDETEQKFLGYIHKSSSYRAEDDNRPVEDFARPMASFSTDARLEDVLISMLNDHNHMALVVDPFENWVGIITLEDVIETILGNEIIDEKRKKSKKVSGLRELLPNKLKIPAYNGDFLV